LSAARLDPSGDERLPAIDEHDHVTRLAVRNGMRHSAEVVAGRVMEAVATQSHRPKIRPMHD
jgi:hypothetical protein